MRIARTALPALALIALATAALAAPPRFAAAFTWYGGIFGVQSLAIADVNHDGHPDVISSTPPSIEVRLGTGDGALGPPAQFFAGSVKFLALGDLNGDDVPDLVTSADSLNLAVLLANGDGTFAPRVTYSTAKGPESGALVDLDGDGHLDVLCPGVSLNQLSVRLGDGSGGFGSRTDYPTGGQPASIAAGDLDHDGDADVVVLNRQSQDLTRLLGDGNGGLASSLTIPLGAYPWQVLLADLDGDTWLDAVVQATYDAQFQIAPGLPGGSFGALLTRPLPGVTIGMAVGHVDADATLDVVALDYYRNRGVVLPGSGGFAFEAPRFFAAGRAPNALVLGDLNGGGKLDVVTSTAFASLCVHMGNGDGKFGGLSDLGMGNWTWAVACADLDADGRVDIATTSMADHTVVIRFGESSGTFSAPLVLPAGNSPAGITIADIDLDGDRDIVIAQSGPGTQTASSVAWFLGDGARGFAARQEAVVGRWAQDVAVGDLDGDAYPDLAVACNDFASSLTLLHGQPGGGLGGRADLPLGSNANDVEIADVTRDGLPDVLLACYGSNQAFVLPRNSEGSFHAPIPFSVTGATSVAAGDVVGDLAPDLIVSGANGVSVFPSIPLASFDNVVLYPGGTGPLAVADFDVDGRVDVATANGWNSNTVSLWFGQVPSGLVSGDRQGAGDRPNDLAVGDVNGDGLPDLVTANVEGHSVSLLANTGGVAWLPWLGLPPEPPAPSALALRPRPNPFHARGWFDYALPRAADVRLRVLDVAGRELVRFEARGQRAGVHTLRWDARGTSPGVYFAELAAGNDRLVRRVILLP